MWKLCGAYVHAIRSCAVRLQVKPDPPVEEWEPTKHTVRVNQGEDLWRVCHKSKYARLCVPCLEFEIQADGQRHIDSLYNHIGNAITNLAAHCSSMRGGAHCSWPGCIACSL